MLIRQVPMVVLELVAREVFVILRDARSLRWPQNYYLLCSGIFWRSCGTNKNQNVKIVCCKIGTGMVCLLCGSEHVPEI